MRFWAWGAEVDGKRGLISTPLSTRWQWRVITARVLRLGTISRERLERMLGVYCSCFIFRRELLALFHHIYKWGRSLVPGAWTRLPHFIADELRAAAAHLAVARWDMLKSLSPQLLATDATPTTGGAVACVAPVELARAVPPV